MGKLTKYLAGATLAILASGTATAADMPAAPPPAGFLPWFVHFGPGGIILDVGAKVSLLGVPVPGAGAKVDPQLTVVIEAGYYFTPNFAVSFTGGYPPTVDVMGKGALAPLGRLGSMTYGPMTLTGHYHFDLGRFRPYIGAGPTFMVVLGERDGALANLKINNTIGFGGQIGFDYMFSEKLGVFVDVKKSYLRTTATGTLGGAPTRTSVRLDPLVLHTGVSYRF